MASVRGSFAFLLLLSVVSPIFAANVELDTAEASTDADKTVGRVEVTVTGKSAFDGSQMVRCGLLDPTDTPTPDDFWNGQTIRYYESRPNLGSTEVTMSITYLQAGSYSVWCGNTDATVPLVTAGVVSIRVPTVAPTSITEDSVTMSFTLAGGFPGHDGAVGCYYDNDYYSYSSFSSSWLSSSWSSSGFINADAAGPNVASYGTATTVTVTVENVPSGSEVNIYCILHTADDWFSHVFPFYLTTLPDDPTLVISDLQENSPGQLSLTVQRTDGAYFGETEDTLGCAVVPAGSAAPSDDDTASGLWGISTEWNAQGYLVVATDLSSHADSAEFDFEKLAPGDYYVYCARLPLYATGTAVDVAKSAQVTITKAESVTFGALTFDSRTDATLVVNAPDLGNDIPQRCVVVSDSAGQAPIVASSLWSVNATATILVLDTTIGASPTPPPPPGGSRNDMTLFDTTIPVTLALNLTAGTWEVYCGIANSDVATLSVSVACPAGAGKSTSTATSGCQECAAGKYAVAWTSNKPTNYAECTACPNRTNTTSTNSTSADACTACATGRTYSATQQDCLCNPGTGGANCDGCTAHTYSAYSSSTKDLACVACADNKTSPVNSTSADACVACGTDQQLSASGTCEKKILCTAGYEVNTINKTCVACAAGKFQKYANVSTACETCPVNTFSPLSGATACLSCPTSYYSGGNLATTTCYCNATGSFVAVNADNINEQMALCGAIVIPSAAPRTVIHFGAGLSVLLALLAFFVQFM